MGPVTAALWRSGRPLLDSAEHWAIEDTTTTPEPPDPDPWRAS